MFNASVAALALALTAPAGVGFAQEATRALPCDSTVVKNLPSPSFDLRTLAGRYTLTLVATSGTQSGKRIDGAAELVRSDTSHRSRRPKGTVVQPMRLDERVFPPGLLPFAVPRSDSNWLIIVQVGSGNVADGFFCLHRTGS